MTSVELDAIEQRVKARELGRTSGPAYRDGKALIDEVRRLRKAIDTTIDNFTLAPQGGDTPVCLACDRLIGEEPDTCPIRPLVDAWRSWQEAKP